MKLQAGTYRFNNEINIDSNMGEFDLPFTVNNLNVPDSDITSLTCNKIIIYKEYSEEWFDYSGITYVSTMPIVQGGITHEEVIVYINGNLYGEMYNHLWAVEGIQTHTITEDTEVDDTFGTWYIANTNYNEVNSTEPSFDSIKAKMQVLIDKSNAKTGKNDTDLYSAFESLLSLI